MQAPEVVSIRHTALRASFAYCHEAYRRRERKHSRQDEVVQMRAAAGTPSTLEFSALTSINVRHTMESYDKMQRMPVAR